MADRLQTDEQRRVLAHLPRYYTDAEHADAEAHEREVNRLPDSWELERSSTLTRLAQRLNKDEGLAHDVDTLDVLEQLRGLGFVDSTIDGRWAQTEAGFAALQTLSEPEQAAHEAALAAIAAEAGGN